jgi:hypothetical protein
MLNSTMVERLGSTVANLLESVVEPDDGVQITRVTMGELADGSRRSYALIDTYDTGIATEQQFRVISPSPEDAPKWAEQYVGWLAQVRTGENEWLNLADFS